jgi:hypothetical protein
MSARAHFRLIMMPCCGQKLLLASFAALLMATSAAHACELEVKILKNNTLHVLEKCAGIETFHKDWVVHHPRGEQYHDAEHECKLLSVEQIDKRGANVLTYCKYRKGGETSGLVIQSTENGILLTNAENY